MKHLLPALALALLALGCRATTPSWLSVPDPTTQHGVEVVVDGVVRGTTWMSGVTGTATNLSGGRLTRCRISFCAYDMQGDLLGTARAECGGLESDETWRFQAEFPGRIEGAKTLASPTVRATR